MVETWTSKWAFLPLSCKHRLHASQIASLSWEFVALEVRSISQSGGLWVMLLFWFLTTHKQSVYSSVRGNTLTLSLLLPSNKGLHEALLTCSRTFWLGSYLLLLLLCQAVYYSIACESAQKCNFKTRPDPLGKTACSKTQRFACTGNVTKAALILLWPHLIFP